MRTAMIILLTACIALAAGAAFADDGLMVEVVNKTGKELDVRVDVNDWEKSRSVSRTVADGGTITIPKSETKHDEGVLVAHWEVVFHNNCTYRIMPKDDGECTRLVSTGDCANIEDPGGSCAIRFVVGK